MKKKFLSLFFLLVITLNAQVWTVTTTCGVVGNINIADNATVSQIAAAVRQFNYNSCGVTPKIVRITFSE